MELIKCPNCGGDVSSNASFCTNCGSPLNNNLPRYTNYQNGNMGYAQNMPGQYMKNKTPRVRTHIIVLVPILVIVIILIIFILWTWSGKWKRNHHLDQSELEAILNNQTD